MAFFVAALGLLAAHLGRSSSQLLYHVQEIKPKIFVWIPDDVINQDADPLFTRGQRRRASS